MEERLVYIYGCICMKYMYKYGCRGILYIYFIRILFVQFSSLNFRNAAPMATVNSGPAAMSCSARNAGVSSLLKGFA